MIVSWMVYCLLVSALVSAAAWLGERAARAQGWPGRWSWAGAFAATVAFPVWAWLAPSSPEPAAGPLPGAYVMEALPALVLEPSSPAGPSVTDLLLLGWAAATGLLLLWLAMSAARLWAAERRWDAEELDGVRVLVSERTGPAALGLVRARVVLPRWALGMETRLRRLMVLHEAEHVRAGDPQLASAGLLVCALMPWNLPVWWQLRRLRLAIEMDCDARVLRRSGGDLRGYGALLLEVGQGQARLALGLTENRTSLERRIRTMTNTMMGRRTLQALALTGLSALVLAVACETPGPTDIAAEPERRPVELAEVEQLGSERCDPVFFVNGDRTELAPGENVEGQDQVHARIETRLGLQPDEIARIAVFKGARAKEEAGADCGVIVILTKDATAEERRKVETLTELLGGRQLPRKTTTELAEAPTFTPMTQRPALKNARAVQESLMANYPPLLRDAGIGGTTNVWFFITEDGTVQKVQINKSSGHPALDQAALKVAGQMEFEPALNRNQPVPVWLALNITFEVDRSESVRDRSAAVDRASRELAETEAALEKIRDRIRNFGVEDEIQIPPTPEELRSGVVRRVIPREELAKAPTFTPMTERPRLRNQQEIQRALMNYYPPLLRDAGIPGTVNTWVFIDETGRVAEARVNQTSGYEAFDGAALMVAQEMEFTPAKNGEKAVPVWVALDITFEVNRTGTEPSSREEGYTRVRIF